MVDAMMTSRSMTTWSIVLSVLMILAGALASGAPMLAGIAMTLIVGWMLLFSGVLHLVFAWSGHGARTIIGEIVIAIVYGAIGVCLLANPLMGLTSLTVALAIYLVITGALELVLAVQLRPLIGSGWLLVAGIVALALEAMIYMSWPSATLWVIGTLVGISMVFSGISRLAMTMALRRPIAA